MGARQHRRVVAADRAGQQAAQPVLGAGAVVDLAQINGGFQPLRVAVSANRQAGAGQTQALQGGQRGHALSSGLPSRRNWCRRGAY